MLRDQVGRQLAHGVPVAAGALVAAEVGSEVHQVHHVDEAAAFVGGIEVAHELHTRELLAAEEARADPLHHFLETAAREHRVARGAVLARVFLVGAAQAEPDAEVAADHPQPDRLPGGRHGHRREELGGSGAVGPGRIELAEDLGQCSSVFLGELLGGELSRHGILLAFLQVLTGDLSKGNTIKYQKSQGDTSTFCLR